MSRIQRYLNNIVIIPLYQRNFNLDEESLGSSKYEETASGLATASIDAKSNLSVVSNSLRSDCEFKCDVSDFKIISGDYFITNPKANKTIKCRVYYRNYDKFLSKIIRPEINELKENLDVTNITRIYGATKDGLFTRTYGMAIVRHQDGSSYGVFAPSGFPKAQIDLEQVKSVSEHLRGRKGQEIWEFAKPFSSYTDPKNPQIDIRIYQTQGNKSHSEMAIMEYIAQKECRKDSLTNSISCNTVTVDIFTDRRTCNGCNNVLNNITTITPDINIKFHDQELLYEHKNQPLQGIFYSPYETGADNTLETEQIPTKKENYYREL